MNNTNSVNDNSVIDWILHNDQPSENNCTNEPASNDEQLIYSLLFDDTVTNMPSPPKQQVSSPSEEEDILELTEAQLKQLPSKQRRQLRNKISARNFRNRRKEYIATLESKMKTLQEENSQLKLEVKWVREMMDKLQADNDRLRVELVLCKGGISQPPFNIANTLASITDHPAMMPSPPTTAGVTTTVASNDMAVPPAPVPSMIESNALSQANWDLVTDPSLLPINNNTITSSSSSSNDNNNTIYLAHALFPDWDLTSIMNEKITTTTHAPQSTEFETFIRTYPLLAFGLMSIVLQHAMTTQGVLPDHPSLPPYNNSKQQHPAEPIITQYDMQEIQKYFDDDCPLRWLQKQFCKFIILYLVVKYPRLDKPCRTYLPICDKYRIQSSSSF
ncbi:MAG: hypothetical protein EXX96DRAFT_330475 [Benjaminiella poitrasii]|nr:MAG: hypothetical protein EXX96DRAFT_330475 [Benjaminiella poitrasii]